MRHGAQQVDAAEHPFAEVGVAPVAQAHGAAGTLVRLTHRGLPADSFDDHRAGWEHYLDRLAALAAGGDPGPDPLRTA